MVSVSLKLFDFQDVVTQKSLMGCCLAYMNKILEAV